MATGWNGSDRKGGSAPIKPKAAAKKPSPVRGIVAGLLVVGVSAVAYFAFFSGNEKSWAEKSEKERGRIKEVVPAAAPTNKVQFAKLAKKRPYWEADASETNGFSEAMIRKWKFMHQPPPSYTNTAMASRPPPKYAIFPTHAENEIACLMTLKPGQSLVGTPRYTERFKNEFLKSCETPIIVEEGDDEYTAQLKRDMVQMKIELRQRMADGEDLGQIMLDARKELQRMSQVKREIEQEVRKMIKEGAQTEDDIDTYVEAANKMLEQKGIAPMKMNPLSRRALIHSIKNSKK